MMTEPTIGRDLIQAARRAAQAAYAPYSHFPVGAALMDDDGRVHTGCNVENASYGLTLCAERVALTKAVSEGRTRFLTLMIYTPTSRPTPPCGACRQVLGEFAPELEIIATCDGPEVLRATLDELLPAGFSLK